MSVGRVTLVQGTSYINRPEGRVAYDVDGEGPLVVLVPGMGDLRASYRFVAPALRKGGYRVARTDLRGHGDSDTTFASYGDVETAGDIVALIEELHGPAVVVGNSMGAGAAAYAAAERPDLINGLALIGPFVRNSKTTAIQRVLLRIAMARPWAPISWNSYLPKLYKGQLPRRLRRIPQERCFKSSPAWIRQVLLSHHPHRPCGCRVAPRRGRSTHLDRHGRARP